MSEDVKPRQWTLVFDHDEEIGHIRTPANYSKKNRHEEHVNVIELEPTLQLMEEMGDALEKRKCDEIINSSGSGMFNKHDSNCAKCFILEKYRKFLEGIEK